MSEAAAVLGVIRDGRLRVYRGDWQAFFLQWDLLWGPDDVARWIPEHEELDGWPAPEDGWGGGVVVDYDRRRLVWLTVLPQTPRLAQLIDRLVAAAWPGFETSRAHRGLEELELAAGLDAQRPPVAVVRPPTVRDAAFEDDEPEKGDGEDELTDGGEDGEGGGAGGPAPEEFFDQRLRAWVTLVGPDGTARHVQLIELSDDLLDAQQAARSMLVELPASRPPPERRVLEGMWIDERSALVGLWGSGTLRDELPRVRQGWQGWTVHWAERGYAEQCAASGAAGAQSTEAEMMSLLVPGLLDAERVHDVDLAELIMGPVRARAKRVVGCLLWLICLPLLIFGLVTEGNWTLVLTTIGTVALVVIGGFKVIELTVKRKLQREFADVQRASPPVAGPADPAARRPRVDRLLAEAGVGPYPAPGSRNR